MSTSTISRRAFAWASWARAGWRNSTFMGRAPQYHHRGKRQFPEGGGDPNSSIDVLAVTDTDYQHDLPRFLQFANDTKIPHPVAPQAKLVVPQWSAEIARGVSGRNRSC